MTITCIGCRRREFDLNPADVQAVVTFVCPDCGAKTAVQAREGGGIVIGADNHLETIDAD